MNLLDGLEEEEEEGEKKKKIRMEICWLLLTARGRCVYTPYDWNTGLSSNIMATLLLSFVMYFEQEKQSNRLRFQRLVSTPRS